MKLLLSLLTLIFIVFVSKCACLSVRSNLLSLRNKKSKLRSESNVKISSNQGLIKSKQIPHKKTKFHFIKNIATNLLTLNQSLTLYCYLFKMYQVISKNISELCGPTFRKYKSNQLKLQTDYKLVIESITSFKTTTANFVHELIFTLPGKRFIILCTFILDYFFSINPYLSDLSSKYEIMYIKDETNDMFYLYRSNRPTDFSISPMYKKNKPLNNVNAVNFAKETLNKRKYRQTSHLIDVSTRKCNKHAFIVDFFKNMFSRSNNYVFYFEPVVDRMLKTNTPSGTTTKIINLILVFVNFKVKIDLSGKWKKYLNTQSQNINIKSIFDLLKNSKIRKLYYGGTTIYSQTRNMWKKRGFLSFLEKNKETGDDVLTSSTDDNEAQSYKNDHEDKIIVPIKQYKDGEDYLDNYINEDLPNAKAKELKKLNQNKKKEIEMFREENLDNSIPDYPEEISKEVV